MHPAAAIGVHTLIENTERVRMKLANQVTEYVDEQAVKIITDMKSRYNNEFIDKLTTLLERMTGKMFPSTSSLYELLYSEPFICVVMESNTARSNYPVNTVLISGFYGTSGLIMPDGSTGNTISSDIRLATKDEIIGYAKMIGIL